MRPIFQKVIHKMIKGANDPDKVATCCTEGACNHIHVALKPGEVAGNFTEVAANAGKVPRNSDKVRQNPSEVTRNYDVVTPDFEAVSRH
jgi:hypothetical protein